MKRIISLTLSLVMLLAICLALPSCGMESVTGYTRLRDHMKAEDTKNQTLMLDATAVGINSAAATVLEKSDGEEYICLVGYAVNANTGLVYQVSLAITGSPEKAELTYEVLNASSAERVSAATTTVLLTRYTGSDFLELEAVENISPATELTHRQNATVLLNSLLLALDTYTTAKLDMNLHDLGFTALSDKYMATTETVEKTEEDLGGFCSPARLSKAGIMIVQGMGMVFLVLALLWVVLIIFKKVFYKDPAKEKKPAEPAEAPESAPAPAPALTDDGQLIAVITAAVAAAIESDPALSSSFPDGFRVVSFQKRNGKTSWNH